MNILFLTTHLNPGGITSYLLMLTRGLVGNGNKVFIVSGGGSMESSFKELGAETLVLNIRTKSELDPRIYLALIPLSRFVKENNIDVIHSQTRITQVMGHLLKKLTGRLFVTTCHGFFKPRLSRRIFSCWGDRVIAISPAVKDHLEKDFCVEASKIISVPHGIEVEQFPDLDVDTKTQRRKDFGLKEDDLAIGIIARLSDVKGHDILIEAMAMVVRAMPNARLLIVGEGRMESELKVLVDELELEEYVSFHPIVNKTAEILPIFDVFVMPSRQEGLGLSVMEAQACGVPVVASRIGGLPSLIEDEKTGLLIVPGDIENLSQAIIRVLSDKEFAKGLGDGARQFIIKKHSLAEMIEKTEKVYSGAKK